MSNLGESKSGRKVAFAIFGTLVLGALGSGIWDRVGGPLFDFLTRAIVDGMDFITRSYKDSIYRDASYGFKETSSAFIHQLYISLLPLLYLFIIARHPWLKERIPGEGKSKLKEFLNSSKGFYVLSAVTVAVFIQSFVSFSRINYVRAVITYAHSTIDRLAPHIDEQREEVLLAQFRSVRTAEDYYAFYEELQIEIKTAEVKDFGRRPL